MAPWFSDSWGKSDPEQDKRDSEFTKKRNEAIYKKVAEILKNNPFRGK